MFTSLLSGFLLTNVDKLAKAALNRASCSGKLICWSDLKPKINAYIHSIWQKNWDAEGANKLHEVLPNLGEDLHRRGEGDETPVRLEVCLLSPGCCSRQQVQEKDSDSAMEPSDSKDFKGRVNPELRCR
ncbi:ribonuclease hi [Plakobranchus ocellatus]|uniref:Ribonuclease hi n=1 Tax=Plakobranchus ocellatus TaxID=259542 RepID=A0AAV3YWU1_9GAST|nr:ribonuclease hi [Plakobranchus ocellatus]